MLRPLSARTMRVPPGRRSRRLRVFHQLLPFATGIPGERPARLECRWQKAAIGERREDALIGALAEHAWFLPRGGAACCAPTKGKEQNPREGRGKARQRTTGHPTSTNHV